MVGLAFYHGMVYSIQTIESLSLDIFQSQSKRGFTVLDLLYHILDVFKLIDMTTSESDSMQGCGG